MVRTLFPINFRPPWPFIKKGAAGHRKIGPFVFEKYKWPGQNKEFPELSPKFMKNNREELRRYTDVRPMGYNDPNTGEFVLEKEMIPELIVPDLSGFKLKPYVSYRTDVEIRKRMEKTDAKRAEEEQPANMRISLAEDWPPPKTTPEALFDHFYADKVRDTFLNQLKEQK